MKKRLLHIAIAVFVIAAITGIIASFTDSSKPESQVSQIKFEDNLLNLTGATINLEVKQQKNISVLIESGDDFSANDLQLVSTNNDIANAKVVNINTHNDGYSDFNNIIQIRVTGVSAGETTLYIQTSDGKVKTNKVAVHVKESDKTQTTTESATEETTTEKQTTTETTTKKQTTTEKQKTTKAQTTKQQEITVILNTNTGVYHLSSHCRAVSKMKDENKKVITVNDISEIDSKYKPCGICAK